MNILKMLKYPILSGIYIPFKIYGKVFVKIKNKKIKLSGRLNLGNKKNMPIVSVLPVNIFIDIKTDVFFGGSISIGPGVNIIVKKNAKFSVGNNTYFTSDSHIEAVNKISIGSNCAISWGVTIIDVDHHEIIYDNKRSNKNNHVIIGDKVWIACNVTILKGTKVGNNSVVAAGSVLNGEYPANSLIAGVPARVIKSNINWE